MGKKNALKAQQEEEMFSFPDMDEDFYEDGGMIDIMSGLLDASNNQMMMALELTKLIVANHPATNMEEHVFSVFKKATAVVAENDALKKIMEQMQR